MRKQTAKKTTLRNAIICSGLSFALALGIFIPKNTAMATTAGAGVSVTEQTTIEVMVPLTTADVANLQDGDIIYIDSSAATEHMAEGDLALNASAYVKVNNNSNPYADSIDRYPGHDATYRFRDETGERAPGFDGCPAGQVYTNDGSQWYYSCCYGGVRGLAVTPYKAVKITADLTVTMKNAEYKYVDGEELIIVKDDVEKIEYKYNYTYTTAAGNTVVKEGELPRDKFNVVDGEITATNPKITISYGLGSRMQVTVPVSYPVTFDPGEGTGEFATQYVRYNNTASKPENVPTLEGYNFLYWSLTPGGEEYVFTENVIKAPTVLYAVWNEAQKTKEADIVSNTNEESPYIATVAMNNDVDELADALLTPEEKQAARTGLDTRIFLLVEDITKTVTADTKETIEKSLESGDQIGCFLDINLYKQIGDTNAPIQIKNVPGNKISVTVKIKDALVNKDTSFSRSYVVYRYHEGTVTKIPATYDAVSQTITFETDAFSVYAVGYSDTKIKAEAPKTGDGAPIGAAVLLLIASAAGAVFVTAKKTK